MTRKKKKEDEIIKKITNLKSIPNKINSNKKNEYQI